jgi:hypothetical protein
VAAEAGAAADVGRRSVALALLLTAGCGPTLPAPPGLDQLALSPEQVHTGEPLAVDADYTAPDADLDHAEIAFGGDAAPDLNPLRVPITGRPGRRGALHVELRFPAAWPSGDYLLALTAVAASGLRSRSATAAFTLAP